MKDEKLIKTIVSGCKKGNARSFERLVDMYSSRLYSYFYRLTGSRDTSGDLVSQLFLKLVEKIGSFSGSNFEAWLFKMASNLFYDHLRRVQRDKKLIEGAFGRARQQDICESAPKTSQKQVHDELQQALARLDAEQAELITMRYYSRMSFAALARARGEPVGTTLSKVHRSLKKLREHMEHNNEQ